MVSSVKEQAAYIARDPTFLVSGYPAAISIFNLLFCMTIFWVSGSLRIWIRHIAFVTSVEIDFFLPAAVILMTNTT